MKTILQKFIAESGFCSRRQAEELVRSGKVLVDGQPAELGQRVDEENEVKVNGRIVKPALEKTYIILNKPVGYTCTSRDFRAEKNVFALLPAAYAKGLFIVGRLDKDSSGLLLLTNDGGLAARLTHPRYGHEKEYRIELSGQITHTQTAKILAGFKKGVDIGEGDGVVKAKDAEYLQKNVFKIILSEGKKRQIRRMFRVFGLQVAELKRTRIKNLRLGDLKPGQFRPASAKEVSALLD